MSEYCQILTKVTATLLFIIIVGIYMTKSTIDTKAFEGLRLHVYKDTVGKSTIGYGHNLQGGNNANIVALGIDPKELLSGRRDLTLEEADKLFNLDMNDVKSEVKQLVPHLDTMPLTVQQIVCDLAFNMGLKTLSTFKNTLKAFNTQDYKAAAQGLQNSKWYKQVGNRGRTIITTLKTVS